MSNDDKLLGFEDLPEKHIGYPITIKKFTIFSLLSFGLFPTYWAYRNFKSLYGPGTGKTVGAVVFALFLPVSLFEMMKRYEQIGNKLQTTVAFNKFGLAWVYFLGSLTAKACDRIEAVPFGVDLLIFTLSILPLIAIQKKINALNSQLRPDLPFAPRLSILSWILVGIGIIATALAVLGAILGPVDK